MIIVSSAPSLPSFNHLLVGKVNWIRYLTILLAKRAHAPAVAWVGDLDNVEYISFSRIDVGIFLAVVVEVPPYVLLVYAHGAIFRRRLDVWCSCIVANTTLERE